MANSTLLLVDDSVTIQKVVNLTFAGEGIDVIAVSDGNSAMDILREKQPDLVMADVNVPGINGYEICEKVKSTEPLGKIPVILLVGSFEPFDSEEAARVGADSHLTKPFESIAALVDTVHELMRSGAPEDTPRFDDTVEYPSGADLVVDPHGLEFAGGFEDETIEAEHMGADTDEFDQEEVELERAAAHDFGFGDHDEPRKESGETETDEFSFESAGYDEREKFADQVPGEEPRFEYVGNEEQEESAEEETPGEYSFDSDGYDEPEVVASEDAGGTYTDFIDGGDDSPADAHTHAFSADEFIPEQAPEQFESEELLEADGSEEQAPSEVFYREQTYYQSTEFSEQTIAEESAVEDFLPESYEPDMPTGADESAFAPVTVELDESELLELPIDRSDSDTYDEPPVFSAEPEDQFAATIRQPVPETLVSEEPSQSEIPAELVDEIARRVVEKLSEKAVREIAWEVVPDMAEIIIRKMVEERFND